jgi:hypothetical protein
MAKLFSGTVLTTLRPWVRFPRNHWRGCTLLKRAPNDLAAEELMSYFWEPCVTPEHATPFLFGLVASLCGAFFDGVYPTFSRSLERKVEIAQVQTRLFHCDTVQSLHLGPVISCTNSLAWGTSWLCFISIILCIFS